MRIAIDGFELDRNFTGVGRYLKNLLSALLKIDDKNSYELIKRDPEDEFVKDNLKIISIPFSGSHSKWQNSSLSGYLKKERPDIFFSPNHSIPLFYNGRSMMTIHDVSWKGVPKDFSIKERFSRNIKTGISLKKCEKIFTVSEYSKRETLKYYKVNPDKIAAIPSGIERTFKKESEKNSAAFKKSLGISDNSLIVGFLGTMFKRRNIPSLIKAISILRENYDIKLIIAGEIHDRKINPLLKDDSVIQIRRVPEKNLNLFYSSLDLFVYLSEYEGFGFPPLEALMCGCTPLLLDKTSLSEIFSDIAIFIDNTDPEKIARKIREILIEKPEKRSAIIKDFISVRDKFSWEKVASEYLAIFES